MNRLFGYTFTFWCWLSCFFCLTLKCFVFLYTVQEIDSAVKDKYLLLYLWGFYSNNTRSVWYNHNLYLLDFLMCSTRTEIRFARIFPRTLLFTTTPTACLVTLKTRPVFPWKALCGIPFWKAPQPCKMVYYYF